MRRILVANPNTSAVVTGRLVAAARAVAGPAVEIVGATAPFGVPALETPDDLAMAGDAVLTMLGGRHGCDGAIVAAFGDPGLRRARTLAGIPVRGLGEAGLHAAGAQGRRFAIVTVGPAMGPAITARAASLGLDGQLAGIAFLDGGVLDVALAPQRFHAAILKAVARAAPAADAVLLGGAPFAGLAAQLQDAAAVPLVDGLAAALGALLEGRPTPPTRQDP